jgi:hypothetical protein
MCTYMVHASSKCYTEAEGEPMGYTRSVFIFHLVESPKPANYIYMWVSYTHIAVTYQPNCIV